jgi:hypothetical protein
VSLEDAYRVPHLLGQSEQLGASVDIGGQAQIRLFYGDEAQEVGGQRRDVGQSGALSVGTCASGVMGGIFSNGRSHDGRNLATHGEQNEREGEKRYGGERRGGRRRRR